MAQNLILETAPSDPFLRARLMMERGELSSAQELLSALFTDETLSEYSERGVQVSTSLAEVCEALGRYNEASTILSQYDPKLLDSFPAHSKGLLLLAFGSNAYWTNDFPRSITLLNRAREILEPCGDVANVARAFHCLGRSYWALDELSSARESYEMAIEWGRRARKERSVAISYMNLGLVSRHEGDLDEAGMCYRRAFRLLRDTSDFGNCARLQNNLGVMALCQGNFSDSVTAFRRSLDFLARTKSDSLIGSVYNNLAFVLTQSGSWAEAEEFSSKALDIAISQEDHLHEGEYTETLGALRIRQGRFGEANELLRKAVGLANEVGSKTGETQAQVTLARLWLGARNYSLALSYAEKARELALEIRDERLAAEAALLTVEAYRASDRWAEAEDWVETSRRELEQASFPFLYSIYLRNQACFLARKREPVKSERLFEQAEEAFRSMSAAYELAITIFNHGEILARRGELLPARERFADAAQRFAQLGASIDEKRASLELERIDQRIAPQLTAVQPAISLVPPDITPLLARLLEASGNRERLLRELMFASKAATAALGAAVFGVDDEGQLFTQAAIDLIQEQRDQARRSAEKFLRSLKKEGSSGRTSQAEKLHETGVNFRLVGTGNGRPRSILFLRTQSTIAEKRAEILDALVGYANVALQAIDLKADMRRVKPFNTIALSDSTVTFAGVIAASQSMRAVFARLDRLKNSDATVLILGESGVGKEVIARALHDDSPRVRNPFIPFNCTAAARDIMVESQLFGHRRGTFTGAISDQPGLIRAAKDGTLFLDEIGDLSLEAQPKLLRFLQSGEIMPLGEAPRKVNVRVVAATNRDLETDVAEGRFREDLFYRLNTFVIKVPPLRERREDIPLLAAHFFEESCVRHSRRLAGITPEAMSYLTQFNWPGNVRQLKSEIERIVVFAEDEQSVGIESLSPTIIRAADSPLPSTLEFDFSKPVSYKDVMADIERRLLTEAMARFGGNLTKAAQVLGLSRQTFAYRLQRLNLPNRISDSDLNDLDTLR